MEKTVLKYGIRIIRRNIDIPRGKRCPIKTSVNSFLGDVIMTTLYLGIGILFGIHAFLKAMDSYCYADSSVVGALLGSFGIATVVSLGWPLYVLVKYQDGKAIEKENLLLREEKAIRARERAESNKRLKEAAIGLGVRYVEQKLFTPRHPKGNKDVEKKDSSPKKAGEVFWTTTS